MTSQNARDRILSYLRKIGGWPVSEKTIARNLGLKVGTVSKHVSTLVDEGLVTRARNGSSEVLYRATSSTER
jgi:DNA-binding MarR family transcriptional regulator